MVANVKVAFGLVKDEILPSLKEQGKSSKLLAKTVTELTTNFRSVEKAGVKAFRATQTETQKLARDIAGIRVVGEKLKLTEDEINRRIKKRVEDVTGVTAQRKKDVAVVQSLLSKEEKYEQKVMSIGRQLKQGNITRERAIQLVTRLRQNTFGLASETKDVDDAQRSINDRITRTVAGYFGIFSVVQRITGQLEQQLQFENERANLIRSAGGSETTFLVLNRDLNPDQRLREVGELGARFGFGKDEAERAELFGKSAQGLQAALGSPEAGDAALETVLKARRVGVRLDTANELVIQGVSQTPDDPERLLRLLFAAGELSGRDPSTIGDAAPVLNLFDDKVFAAAVATTIGNVRADDIKTFVQASGLALSEQIDRRKLGLTPKSGEVEVIAELRKRVDPNQNRAELIAQLRDFGLSNVRTTNSVIQLLQTYDAVTSRFVPLIEKNSRPGVFDRAYERLAGESERFRKLAELDVQRAESFNARVSGPRSQLSLNRDLRRGEQASELIASGDETFFGVRTVNQEGQLTLSGEALRAFRQFVPNSPGRDMRTILEDQLLELQRLGGESPQPQGQSTPPALTQPIPKEVE